MMMKVTKGVRCVWFSSRYGNIAAQHIALRPSPASHDASGLRDDARRPVRV
jgi:hypothetical protein